MRVATTKVNILVPNLLPLVYLLIGFDIAQYLSALSAVNVKTETPTDTSFAHSETCYYYLFKNT